MTKEPDHPTINKNVQPPFVVLAFLVLAYVLGRFAPIPLAAPAVVRNVGLLFAFLGFLLGMAAFLEFRKARTTLNLHGSARQVVTTGVYRFTRNPIYLGFLLMVVGVPLTSGLYWGVLLAPLYIITMDRLVIQREEQYLERKFGQTYTSYAAQVRRWL